MAKLIDKLVSKKLCTPPHWLSSNTMYLCIMGSAAYGVQTDKSDIDVYGFCIPPKRMIVQPFNDCVPGFDKMETFEQWQEHGIKDRSEGKEYDFSVYNITKYFRLVMENNPNMIDSLFVPRNCVIHSTPISEKIRENRKMFLHRGAWHKFKGFAYSQVHKMNIKEPKEGSKRKVMYDEFGYDLKFAYHTVRLLNEVEQILTEGDLDLLRNKEQLKSIRRGEWSKEKVIQYFEDKEKSLEEIYLKSELPYGPDKDAIRKLLVECIEMYYDLSEFKDSRSEAEIKLDQIKKILW